MEARSSRDAPLQKPSLLTRTQVRQAGATLPSDLRAIASAEGDIYAMSDTSIDFRSTFGTSVVCVSTRTSSQINLPPATLAKGSALSVWSQTPTGNDSLALYVDSTASTRICGQPCPKRRRHPARSPARLRLSPASPKCRTAAGQ